MPSSHHAWLLTQLPEWEREGLITAEAAATLRQRAQSEGEEHGGQLGLVIFGVIGAVLVAAGIIAVLAFNWDLFPRWLRIVIAFLPMAGGQAAAAWVLRKGESVSGWVRESVAVFLGIGVGTCLAVVSQVYNLSGDWHDFMLAWSLLSVPLVWLLSTSSGASLYMLGITAWASGGSWWGISYRWMEFIWYPLLLVPLLPWWPGRNWRNPQAPPLGFRWVAAGCLMWASFVITERLPGTSNLADMQMVLALAAVFVLMPPMGNVGLGRRPFLVVGSLVLFGCGLFLSFDWGRYHEESANQVLHMPLFWVYAALIIWFTIGAVRDRRWASLTISSVALLPLLRNEISASGTWLLVNAQLFATGVFMIMPAFRGETGSPRLGALLLSLVVLSRFIDSDLPLLMKGVGFIIVGIGFIVFNIALARRIRTLKRTTP